MNRSYRTVWNRALGAWVAVSEITHVRGKCASGATAVACAALAFGLAPAFASDGGLGGDPSTSTLTWHAGRGGADSRGGEGGFNDSDVQAFGGAGGDAALAGANPGAASTLGTMPGTPAAGGAGGTAGAPDGQAGGSDAGYGSGGGSGYSSVMATSGANALVLTGGNGGRGGCGFWAAGGGGAGGYGLVLSPALTSFNNSGWLQGGRGGAGGNADAQAGGGGGGGTGLYQAAGATVNTGTLAGGQGGRGGDGGTWQNAPSGGGGGGGGNGVSLNGGSLRNEAGGTISGGSGGAGGNAGNPDPVRAYGWPGHGGGGGEGVRGAGNGLQLFNAGAITGGAGGAGGTVPTGGAPGAAGAGGAGVFLAGDGNLLVNVGSIAGGLSGAGVQANAVTLNGNGNTLELNAGFALIGNAVATGAGNVLALGGSASPAAAFEVGGIGSAYQGFTAYRKTGSSTWALSGSTAALTPWTVTGGALSITSDASLGDGAGRLTLDGGGLQVAAAAGPAMAVNRAITLGAAGGTLDVRNSQATLNGPVDGSGGLVKTGAGTLVLPGANSYGGGTALKAGRIDVGHNSALGAGALAMDENTTLGFSTDGLNLGNDIVLTGTTDPIVDTGAFSETLSGVISGGGALTKNGSGQLTLSGLNSYSGATTVAAGTLRAGIANAFSAASAHSVAAGATLDTGGFNQTVAALSNSGTVSLLGASAGSELTVRGAYVGNNGTLRLGTVLASNGVSDKLVLDGAGASASGRTTVAVTNIGGLGGYTLGNGIEVVSARNGATTTAQTTKSAFALAGGHVDAGAYEYRLYAADAGGAGESWYLRSDAPVLPPVPPVVDPVNPGGGGTPPAPPISMPLYRAEVPLYAALPAQLRQTDLAMLGNLHRRIGDNDPRTQAAIDPAGRASGDRRAWGRLISSDIDIRQQGTVNPASQGRVNGFQAGTDLWAHANWRAGVYVGQLEGDVRVSGFARGVVGAVGSTDLRARYLGAYATFTADSGLYVDTVLQAGRHRYTVAPNNGALQSGGSGRSLLASVEVGMPFALGGGWTIEPQLQLVHQRQKLDDVQLFGARVHQDSANGWLARAGVRVKGQIATGLGTLQPYGRVNVYRASAGTDIASFIGPAGSTAIASRTGFTSTELAAGFTLALSPAASVYGEVGKLYSTGGDARVKSSVQGSLGLRVRW